MVSKVVAPIPSMTDISVIASCRNLHLSHDTKIQIWNPRHTNVMTTWRAKSHLRRVLLSVKNMLTGRMMEMSGAKKLGSAYIGGYSL
jgi:hypothetical protein